VPAVNPESEPRPGKATRRQAMAVGLTPALAPVVLGGCSLRVGQPVRVSATTRPPTKDESARERAARLADRLADDLTDAARATSPGSDQANRLLAVAANHRAQATALRPAGAVRPAGTRPGRLTPRPTTGVATTGVATTGAATTGVAALRALATRERAAAATLAQDLRTTAPDTSRLLASVRASCLVQVERLDRWAREGDR
jgi:hypothetical protein